MASKSVRILVAPLNWGLGHATRCIPIIRHLIARGCTVVLASDGSALALLRREFPDLEAHEIPSYNVTYKTGNMLVNIGLRTPAIIRTIYREHKWLKDFVKSNEIDAVISDNRFGLYHNEIPSAVISHQINIPIPGWILYWAGNRINHRLLGKYNDIWVPDINGPAGLSGNMSHQTPIDDKLTYLGVISRMKQLTVAKKFDVIVVLSGPEPQRTNLEHIILRQLAALPYKCLMVRGLPEISQRVVCSSKLEMISFMTSEELNEAIAQSDLVISRSGYTTVLDLVYLNKKALFIPTPGQTEQEYLAENFKKHGVFHAQTQDKLNLSLDIPKALEMKGFERPDLLHAIYPEVLDKWLERNGLMSQSEVESNKLISIDWKESKRKS